MPFTVRGKVKPQQIPTSPQSPLSSLPTQSWTTPPSLSPTPTAGTYWLWSEQSPGYAPYKNEILIRYQSALSACGIPRLDQRLFVQQLTQENGALNPTLTGGTDLGYSFGLGQWNTRPLKASRHLQLHPEQATLDWQIAALAETSCALYKRYPGNTRRAIVHHNCPECARSNEKPSLCSSVDSLRKIGSRWTCYFDNEVNGEASRSRFDS